MSNFDPPPGSGQPGWQEQPTQHQPSQQQQQPGQPQQPGWQQQPPQQPGWQQQGLAGQSVQSTAKKAPVGRILLGLALVAILGVAGFAVFKAFSGSDGGAASPAEAAENLVTSFENEDFLTIGESLAPNEREAMFEPSIDLLQELERLDIVDEGTSEDGVSGVEITLEGVDPRIEPVTDTISWVTIDSGTVTITTNPAELPTGDLLEDDVAAGPVETEVTNFADEPIEFAVVEENGKWYLSLYYTAAEQIRRSAGESTLPNPDTAPEPVGAASPEEVVTDMVAEMSDLDAEGVLTLMDPEEFQAAYDYSSLYLPEAQAELDSLRSDAEANDASWTVDEVTTRSEERNGDTVVIVTNITFTATSNGETVTIVWDGNCLTYSGDIEAESYCRQDLLDELEPGDPVRSLLEVDYGFRVVEREGRWYMSGYSTLVGGYADGLGSLSPEQLEQLFGSGSDDVGGVGGLFDELDDITI